LILSFFVIFVFIWFFFVFFVVASFSVEASFRIMNLASTA